MKPALTIRSAFPADVPAILAMVRELAEYEKLSDQCVATEEQFHTALFGEKPHAEALLGEVDGAPAAFALFFHNFSTFAGKPGLYLEDLYVKPEHRGKGYGKTLLKSLAKLAVERNCARFEWTVLDWNEPAIRAYDSIGAASLEDWRIRRLEGEVLNKLAG